MTFIDVVYPCVETLIFSARKIHLFLFSYSCQHYLFRYVPKGFALGSSIYWMFRYPGEALAFSWPNFGILLRPVTFSMPYWNRLRPFWPLSYYAFIKRWLLPSLLHGCFFQRAPHAHRWSADDYLNFTKQTQKQFVSNKTFGDLLIFWDLHFGSGLFPFWQWPLSATFWLFTINLMVFLG